MNHRRLLGTVSKVLAAVLLAVAGVTAHADAASLRAKYDQLRAPLAKNTFQRALVIESSQRGDTVVGDVYAVLDHPFNRVSGTLKDANEWCAIMMLPFNTKYCKASEGGPNASLQVRIGRKFDQPVKDAYRIDFNFLGVVAQNDFFQSRLEAKAGPVGTHDYRIAVSAVPLDGGRTFMHLGYSYAYGMAGKIAMQAYLSTTGSSKAGFSVSGHDGNGQPVYIGGALGAIERNAMRYYLAIDSHLGSLSAPPEQQQEKRIQAWFTATERYPRQLREMDRATYVAMKRGEYERSQAPIP